MIEFDYVAPTDLHDAAQRLADAGDQGVLLAGGTDIIVQLREGLRSASLVVDIKKIDDLLQLAYSPETGLQLGASVSCWRLQQARDVADAYPALIDAARIIGGWQIQTRASVGGNLCNSSPAADTIPPLIAHGAVAHIVGPDGRRTVPVRDFCTAPGRNVLQRGEVLVAMTLPPPSRRSGSAYQRFIPRYEMDIAVAGAASWMQLDGEGGRIEAARIALSAVAPTPVLASEASDFLVGKQPDEDLFREAGELARRAASPIDDMRGPADYRRHLVGVLTARTLSEAARRAGSTTSSLNGVE